MKHTEIKVFPKNWEKSIKANLSKDWYIYYEFNGKHIRFRGGLNYCKDLASKQEMVRRLVTDEQRNLKNGYNPITKEFENRDPSLNEDTPFIVALNIVADKVRVADSTRISIKDQLKIVNKAALKTGLSSFEVSKVRKRDIRLLLDEVLDMKYSNDKYNRIKSYLGILYNYLVDLEIFEHNYINDIKKLPHTQKRREIFRDEDIKQLEELKEQNYLLWRFLMIFHCSQSRISEIRQLRIDKVDFKTQTFSIYEKKGKNYKWVLKPINMHTSHLWKEILKECSKDDIYFFGDELKPSDNFISMEKFEGIRRYWWRKLKITKTPYALRHTFANNIANELGIAAASEALGHTNQKTTEKYAVDYRENLVKKQASLSSPLIKSS